MARTHTRTHIELYRLGRCDLAGEHFGYAEVSDLQNVPLPVEHDILRLQVTVQDVQFVDMVNGHQKLDKEEKNVLQEEEEKWKENHMLFLLLLFW